MGDRRRGQVPSPLANMVPCPEATIRLPQYKTLLGNMSDFNRLIGGVPPPSHSWMALVVEDMLREARAGLMEAVVNDPGRAILFYGRHLMGEGLRADEAGDATFLLHRS